MVRPKKHLGQHFLTDTNTAAKIVESLGADTKNLLEIGPGTGVLTKFLIEKNIPNYHVIDIDKESIAYLEDNFEVLKGRIIFGDFLKFDLSEIFQKI